MRGGRIYMWGWWWWWCEAAKVSLVRDFGLGFGPEVMF